jgi:hypothetical protein
MRFAYMSSYLCILYGTLVIHDFRVWTELCWPLLLFWGFKRDVDPKFGSLLNRHPELVSPLVTSFQGPSLI